ncbi:uncharacterized protein LOC109135467 [Beta vulgaris subsp. vulgaris]|uniref:uncharacterized protein LOC109135467 n=1 Tax=Beta vulgaris subsp. vulgaris TaxID=3555 RepID=UPI000900CADF|nr:uncharacterized protein LOC109135467 [Beta vulgaris subsp. vulgaris]
MSSEDKFEIVDGKSTLPVSLNNHTCVCGAWQLSGLPCKHAMRAIHTMREDPHKYVSNWYSVQLYKKAYSGNIKSIPDQEQWTDSTHPLIQPPTLKRGIGRPSRNRRLEEDEKRKGQRSKTIRCSKCNTFGHNARTCKGGPTGKEKAAVGGKKKPNNEKATRQSSS